MSNHIIQVISHSAKTKWSKTFQVKMSWSKSFKVKILLTKFEVVFGRIPNVDSLNIILLFLACNIFC